MNFYKMNKMTVARKGEVDALKNLTVRASFDTISPPFV